MTGRSPQECDPVGDLERVLQAKQILHDPFGVLVEGVGLAGEHELWQARCAARTQLVGVSRSRATQDRLRRGEDIAYVEAVAHGFDPDRLTVGSPAGWPPTSASTSWRCAPSAR